MRLSSICCLSSFVFACSLVICWQRAHFCTTDRAPLQKSLSTWRWHSSSFSLWAPHHTLSSLCACYNLSPSGCARPSPLFVLRKPLILSLECLPPPNSVATTCDCQLHTQSNYKLLGEKNEAIFELLSRNVTEQLPLLCTVEIKMSLFFLFVCLTCVSCCARCSVFTQNAWPADLGRTASSGVNVRTAASVTDGLDGAAAALAGLESAVRKVRPRVKNELTYRNFDVMGKCCIVETLPLWLQFWGVLLIIASHLHIFLLSVWCWTVWRRLPGAMPVSPWSFMPPCHRRVPVSTRVESEALW